VAHLPYPDLQPGDAGNRWRERLARCRNHSASQSAGTFGGSQPTCEVCDCRHL